MNTQRSSAGPPCLQLFQLCRQDRLCTGSVLASICHTTKISTAPLPGTDAVAHVDVPVQTRPAVEVTTHSHYWLSGNFITYVAFISTAIEHLVVIPSRTSRKGTVVTSLCSHTCRGHRINSTAKFAQLADGQAPTIPQPGSSDETNAVNPRG